MRQAWSLSRHGYVRYDDHLGLTDIGPDLRRTNYVGVLGLIRYIHGVTPSHEGECTTLSPPSGGARCRVEVYLLGHIRGQKKTPNPQKFHLQRGGLQPTTVSFVD